MRHIRKIGARLSLLVACLLLSGVVLAACGASASTPASTSGDPKSMASGAGDAATSEPTVTGTRTVAALCSWTGWQHFKGTPGVPSGTAWAGPMHASDSHQQFLENVARQLGKTPSEVRSAFTKAGMDMVSQWGKGATPSLPRGS